MIAAIRHGRFLALAAILLLMLAPRPGLAQSAPGYEVHNISNATLSFSTMDPVRGTWRAQTIHPDERKSFVFHSGAHNGRIRVATNGRGYVEYDVQAGQRYTVGWDTNKGVWDFRSRGPTHAATANPSPVQNVRAGAQLPTWTLHNKSNERVAFQTLDPARGTWKDQVSYPHQLTPYSLNSGAANGKIRVTTQNRGYVEYDVYAGRAYNLVWDDRKGVWDVRMGQASHASR